MAPSATAQPSGMRAERRGPGGSGTRGMVSRLQPRGAGQEITPPGPVSWWIGLSRADLNREAARRAPLMSSSREGSRHSPVIVDDWSAIKVYLRKRKLQGLGTDRIRRHA